MEEKSDLVVHCQVLNELAVVHAALFKLLDGNEGGLGQLLVVTADLYLLAVFENLLQGIRCCGKLLKLLVQFLLDVGRNLVGTLANDGNALVDVAGLFTEVHDVACHRVGGRLCLLVIHIVYCFLNSLVV